MSWNEIDHEMVRHKLSLIAQEMQPKVVSEERRVLFECRRLGNSGALKPRLVELHVALTDEWLDRIYNAYCEVWATQRRTKSADFVRAVFHNALVPHIATRQAVISEHFRLMGVRKRNQTLGTAGDALAMDLGKLRGKWFDKLEIEAQACKYARHSIIPEVEVSSDAKPGIAADQGSAPQPTEVPVSPVPSMSPQKDKYVSVWDQIDDILVNLKTQEPLNEHIASIEEERRKIEWNHRENRHACAAAILEMAERRADEWMDIRLGTYCEVWKLQNEIANADFLRTLRDNIVEPVVRATVNGERDGLIRKWERCGLPFREGLDAQLASFDRVMKMLERKWKTKLEIAAREWELAKARSGAGEPSLAAERAAHLDSADRSENRAARRRPNLKYRSDLKGAILIQLTKKRDASDLEICRALDADGAVDLPPTWSTRNSRSFESAYMDRSTRGRIESVISKVRADLRKIGFTN